LGKWVALIVAVAAAAVVFLVYRRTAKAAVAGKTNAARTPAGAIAGGALAALTARPRADETLQAQRPIRDSIGAVAGFKTATSVLAPVGTGTVVPTKPATEAKPATPVSSALTSFSMFGAYGLPLAGQSFFIAPKSAPAPTVAVPPPPPPSVTGSTFTRRF
jgi:hypothetical protein